MDIAYDWYLKEKVTAEEINRSENVGFEKGRFFCPYCGGSVSFVRKVKNRKEHFKHTKVAANQKKAHEFCEKYVEAKQTHITEKERKRILKYKEISRLVDGCSVRIRKYAEQDEFDLYIVLPKFSYEDICEYKDFFYKISIYCNEKIIEEIVSVKVLGVNTFKYFKLPVINGWDKIEVTFVSNEQKSFENLFSYEFINKQDKINVYSAVDFDEEIEEYRLLTDDIKYLRERKKYLVLIEENIFNWMQYTNGFHIEKSWKNEIGYFVVFSITDITEELRSFVEDYFDKSVEADSQEYTLLWPPAIEEYEEQVVSDETVYVLSKKDSKRDFTLGAIVNSQKVNGLYLNEISRDLTVELTRIRNKYSIVGETGDSDERIIVHIKPDLKKVHNIPIEVVFVNKRELHLSCEDLQFYGYLIDKDKFRQIAFEQYEIDEDIFDQIKLFKGNRLFKVYRYKKDINLRDILSNYKVKVKMPYYIKQIAFDDKELADYISACAEDKKINKIVLEYILGEIV